MEILFGLLLILIFVLWEIDRIIQRSIDRRIDRASREGNFDELTKLIQIKIKRQRKQRDAASRTEMDQRYLEALLILDAAENGVFLPDGERYFEALDQPEYREYDYDDYGDES